MSLSCTKCHTCSSFISLTFTYYDVTPLLQEVFPFTFYDFALVNKINYHLPIVLSPVAKKKSTGLGRIGTEGVDVALVRAHTLLQITPKQNPQDPREKREDKSMALRGEI